MRTHLIIILLAVTSATAVTFAAGANQQKTDNVTVACHRMVENMRRDASLNTWRNRIKVWPCHKDYMSGGTEANTPRKGSMP